MTDKQRVAERYDAAFADHPLIRPPFLPPYVTQHSWYMYAVALNDSVPRDRVVEELAAAGIETRINWKPVHRQPYHAAILSGDFPVADRIFDTSFTLPLTNGMSLDDAAYVVETLAPLLG